MQRVLITGSSGYIGSCSYEFLKKKYKVFGIDIKVPKIKKQKNFYRCDLTHKNKLNKIIKKINPNTVIHLAGQSTIDGINNKKKYITNNYVATKCLLEILLKNNIKNLIFASTAAIYKSNNKLITENSSIGPNNIYGSTKLECEKKIQKKNINYINFRFFNVCSSLYENNVGEFHRPETHFVPIIVNKALFKKKIKIYGNNFNTKDGTCIRDYIHIKDLLIAFKLAIKYLNKNKKSLTLNLGTGKGYSNLKLIRFADKFFKKKNIYINYKISNKKRYGDSSSLICSNKKAKKKLLWTPKFSNLNKIFEDEYKWQINLKNRKLFIKTIY
jgi:UDP-glucose 4-epimerase